MIDLKRPMNLQGGGKDFKNQVSQLRRHCTEDENESYLATSYVRANRLAPLAVSSKHAMIRGMSTNDYKAKLITRTILAMEGLHQRKHRTAWVDGSLKLIKKPLS